MTFSSEAERREALIQIAILQRECTSDAQYRIYEQRRQEALEARIVKPRKGKKR